MYSVDGRRDAQARGNGGAKRADVKIQDILGATVLHYAAIEAISDSVITMLLDSGADINAKDHRASTPFTWALGYESVTVPRIKLLLLEKNVEIEFFYRPWVSRSYLGTKCDYGMELGKLDPEVYASC
jgi:ankyrin repeat protein